MTEPLTIRDYHNNFYLVNLEEDFNDVLYAIKYEDHGDTFIIVYTNNDEVFAYGWWNGRYHFGCSIRDHIKFKKNYDNTECGLLYRKIYQMIKNFKKRTYYHLDPSSDFYQKEFDKFISLLDELYNTGFKYSFRWNKYSIITFLEYNKLYNQSNIDKINTARWESNNEPIGIAAKENWTNRDGFTCDSIISVWHDGEWHDSTYHEKDQFHEYPIPYRQLPYTEEGPDEWGMYSREYNFQEIKNHLAQMVLFD